MQSETRRKKGELITHAYIIQTDKNIFYIYYIHKNNTILI